MSWEYLAGEYCRSLRTDNGRHACSTCLAFAALFIRHHKGLSQERTIEELMENPCLQYFAGSTAFDGIPERLDSSSLTDFAKRFPADMVERINERMCLEESPLEGRSVDRDAAPAGSSEDSPAAVSVEQPAAETPQPEQPAPNRGKLIMDAVVASQDITFPADVGLLNRCREHLETALDIRDYMPRTGLIAPAPGRRSARRF